MARNYLSNMDISERRPGIQRIEMEVSTYIFEFHKLGVACWPLVPKFAGSNPAEAVGFLRAKRSSARLPSEGK